MAKRKKYKLIKPKGAIKFITKKELNKSFFDDLKMAKKQGFILKKRKRRKK